MKTIKTILPVFLVLMTSLAVRATVLFNDALNYPYSDGLIATQGQWYCYFPSTPGNNTFVTNNVIDIVGNTVNDAVAAPTNGWNNATEYNYASFRVNVSALPTGTNGGYFCQFQDINDTNDCCHVFIETRDAQAPGTYRLAIGNYTGSFNSSAGPPSPFPMDMATNTWYNVVILFDTNVNSLVVGATLFVNPSELDYDNAASGSGSGGQGDGFSYGTDTTSSQGQLKIRISQIGFSPYITAGISNVIVANTFDEVNSTTLPVFGLQPQSAMDYFGNPKTLYAVASGVDVTYQWFSTTYGQLSDNATYSGSQTEALTINSLSASDSYYCVATDAYGNHTTSATAVETVITAPTAPYFSNDVAAVNTSNYLFTTVTFTNTAHGTGPLNYQWYFSTTNLPLSFSPLGGSENVAGQNGPLLDLALNDLTLQGYYYVHVTGADGVINGPTNSLTELAPPVATMLQLHNLELSLRSQIITNLSVVITASPNVQVTGYVENYGDGFNGYTEFFLQDASGYGVVVYEGNITPNVGNNNKPPVGTCLTISGQLLIYHSELELNPSLPTAITTNLNAPVLTLAPRYANSIFNDLSTNAVNTNAMLAGQSLVTFTNAYVYRDKFGDAFTPGSLFTSNGYGSSIYFTIGKYNSNSLAGPLNTNWMQAFVPDYNINGGPNAFAGHVIPTNCFQITGSYLSFGGAPEIIPTRMADFTQYPPPTPSVSISRTKTVSTVSWQPSPGSTYTVYGGTNLLGPWTPTYGLEYYPTNGIFTDTNKSPANFYYISSP